MAAIDVIGLDCLWIVLVLVRRDFTDYDVLDAMTVLSSSSTSSFNI